MGDATETIRRLEENVGRALVGKPEVVRLAVIGLVARGHLLIEDVPGVGKTTLASGLARSIGASFQRIQFTSDMLPSDVLGVSVWEPKRAEFVFKPGPLFTNIVLADEINRTTPKTQSALLEAMNEAQVSLDHSTYPLPRPFMVLATQNPREYEGTFPLPESQLDRFLLRIRIGYPAAADEKAVLRGDASPADLGPVVEADEVLALQEAAERVRMEESVLDYLVALVTATRLSPLLALGVSPRGSLALLRAARARALADGRDYLLPDDIKHLAVPALAHRVIVKGSLAGSAAGGMDGESAVAAILQDVPVPR
ncbi:MAG TPA: MoxR family ATPase [Candidatus Limnocylindria bacterium]|jgi:MoxR-like ATPase|nr:MoxR family ATPase [Candidatus Limnocylindria bacterium]